ncbi:hypothetical protein Taro_011329, partial [Colocasia esculenta]|nr:hypothetical protein [Colocasia esculenta]
HAGRPGDRDRLPDHASSATFPFFLTTRGKIDPGSASHYITTLVHAHIPGPVDAWREFPVPVRDLLFDMFTERSQAAKHNQSTHPEKNVNTSGSVSYVTHSQKLHHELERAPTFRELFDRTLKRKGTNDYVSESARTIAETYDRTMADRYVEGTPQPDLDPGLGSMQREGRGRVECTDLRTAWILLQCCPHMRVRSLLWHTRVHLLRRPAVV